MTLAPPRPVRRTQAERRAATRTALLEATIAGLVEHGYAHLTTAQIVQKAGVTRGAQAHYFSTKAELVVEALNHLAERFVEDTIKAPRRLPDSGSEQLGLLLDRVWAVHNESLFTAALELWVAARTDAELRAHLKRFDKQITASLAASARSMVPALADREDFDEVMLTALASIRGLAMLGFISSTASVNRLWAANRAQLLRLVDGSAS